MKNKAKIPDYSCQCRCLIRKFNYHKCFFLLLLSKDYTLDVCIMDFVHICFAVLNKKCYAKNTSKSKPSKSIGLKRGKKIYFHFLHLYSLMS